MPSADQQKRSLRKRIGKTVAALTADEKREKSRVICEKTASLPEAADAANFMLYYPLPDEVDTRPLMERLFSAGRRVFLPVTEPGSEIMVVEIREEDLHSLVEGHLGIPVPKEGKRSEPSVIDFVIVPGRAFDRRCNRLGRGGGYYDKFLASLKPGVPKVAIAFACQIVDEVPVGAHDTPVNAVVSEDEVIRAR